MILVALLLSLSAHAAPADFLADLLAPGLSTGPRVRAEERVFERKFAAGRPFGLAQTRADVSVPLVSGAGSTWRANAFADYDAIESGASFSTGRVMPNRLWDPGIGVSNVRTLDNGRTVGGSLTVSSPSDRPFSGGNVLGFNLHLSYRLPQDDGNAWILFVSASNTRGLLPWVPMPGAAYYFQSGRHLRGLVGVPFLFLNWQPEDPWTVTLFAVPLRTGELKVAYGGPAAAVQPYVLASFRTRNYMLADRTDTKERLFFEEGLAQAGVNVRIVKGLAVDLGGGQSFERRYFVAEKQTDRSGAPTIRPDNALFASARVQASF